MRVQRKMPSCKTIGKDPNAEDVLFGRGGHTNHHTGNIHFRKLVMTNRSQYIMMKKLEKSALVRKVVIEIHGRGGKFLKFNQDESVWYEVSDREATLKVRQALRDGTPQRIIKMDNEE